MMFDLYAVTAESDEEVLHRERDPRRLYNDSCTSATPRLAFPAFRLPPLLSSWSRAYELCESASFVSRRDLRDRYTLRLVLPNHL